MVNYQNGKIYTIRSRNSDKVYVGSTCNELRKRIYEHKKDYRYWVNGKPKYVSSFEVLKDGMCYIELLEKYPCNDKNELKRREGEVIRSMECVNKAIAGRTPKEYQEEHKEQRKEYHKERYQKIKEEYNKKQKEKITCGCGGVVSRRHKAVHMRSKKHKSWEDMQHDS